MPNIFKHNAAIICFEGKGKLNVCDAFKLHFIVIIKQDTTGFGKVFRAQAVFQE